MGNGIIISFGLRIMQKKALIFLVVLYKALIAGACVLNIDKQNGMKDDILERCDWHSKNCL